MGKLNHKNMMSRWLSNLRFRPLKQQREIKKHDKIAEQVGQPTSAQARAKQFLIFTLTQIGAFKRAGVKDGRN